MWWMAWLVGCDDYVFGVAGSDCPDAPGAGFSGVESLIAESCSGCHSAEPLGNSLDLVTDPYTALTEGIGSTSIPLVVPGDPANSYFYQKITGTNTDGTSPMPVGGLLEECVTDVVREWIESGAAP